ELVERLQHREVQLAEKVGGEHQTAMPVDDERFHVVTSQASLRPAMTCLVRSCGGDPGVTKVNSAVPGMLRLCPCPGPICRRGRAMPAQVPGRVLQRPGPEAATVPHGWR